MLTLALLAGLWSTTCIQTQMSNVKSGYVIDAYQFTISGDFEYRRDWFRDGNCKEAMGHEREAGTVELGAEINSFFAPKGTRALNFSSQQGLDLGAVLIEDKGLRIARGIPNSLQRNTMLNLFVFKKLKAE